jgi:hypothetical protein
LESSAREQRGHAKLFRRTILPEGSRCQFPLKYKDHRLKVYRRTFQLWRSGIGRGPIRCLAGDPRQIFANIISNAIDAMKLGGSLTMRVSASLDWRNQERLGIGTTIADSGTGLGMWVSAQLVERLQGDLRVSSTTHLGRSGTAFSLFFPLDLSKKRDCSRAGRTFIAAASPRTAPMSNGLSGRLAAWRPTVR